MINATVNPTSNTYQPTPVVSAPNANMPSEPMNFKRPSNEPKKIFGIEVRSLLTVLGLTLFFVLAMAGVVISLQQYMNQAPVAPNAPASKPKADITKPATCTLSFTVAGTSTPTPTPTPTPTVTPTPTPTPTATPTYSCNSYCTENSQCTNVNSSYTCYNNYCRLASNPGSINCSQVGCNETCVTNSDCSNSSLVCVNVANVGYRCRLESNPNSENCSSVPNTTTITTTTQTVVVPPEQTTTVLPRSGMDVKGLVLGSLGLVSLGALLIILL